MAHPMNHKEKRTSIPLLSPLDAEKIIARQQGKGDTAIPEVSGAAQLAALLAKHTKIGHVFLEIAVGPEMAEAMLARNTNNRPIRKGRVKLMARAMRARRYRDKQPHPICFDNEGVLRDGQHRLQSVVDSDCTIIFTVCFGCDPAEREYYDQGIPRSVSDIASEHGQLNVVLAQSVVALILRVEQEDSSPLDRIEQTERLDELYAGEPAFEMALKASHRLRDLVTPATASLAIWYIATHTAHGDRLESFIEGVSKGALLAEGSPVLRVRKQLANERGPNGRDSAVRRAGSIVLAWNALMERRRPRGFKWESTITLPGVV